MKKTEENKFCLTQVSTAHWSKFLSNSNMCELEPNSSSGMVALRDEMFSLRAALKDKKSEEGNILDEEEDSISTSMALRLIFGLGYSRFHFYAFFLSRDGKINLIRMKTH